MSNQNRKESIMSRLRDISKQTSVYIFTFCVLVILALEMTTYLKPSTITGQSSPWRNQHDSMNRINSDRHQKHVTRGVQKKPILNNSERTIGGVVVTHDPTASEFITKSDRVVEVLSRKKIVLIVAYMRTGSTLTASLLQEYPGSFYAFEPIRSTVNKFRSQNATLRYLNGTKRVYDSSLRQDTVMNEIKSWLTCQLTDIPVGTFKDIPQSKYIKEFQTCNTSVKHNNQSRSAISLCINKTIARCQNSSLLVLKFIRLRLLDAVKLLPYFPNMKILHLVRDPRGIFNSREHIKKLQTPGNVLGFCNSIKADLNITKSMHTTHPGRIKLLFYEDMAEQPIDTSRAISDFSGIEFTDNMKGYIESQTSASTNSCAYCTARANSSKTANKWRTQLDPKYARYIYTTCEESNKYLGFQPFQTDSDQRDFSLRSRIRLDPDKHSNVLIN